MHRMIVKMLIFIFNIIWIGAVFLEKKISMLKLIEVKMMNRNHFCIYIIGKLYANKVLVFYYIILV